MDGRTTSIPSICQPFLHMTVTDVDELTTAQQIMMHVIVSH